jgi:endonuclease/exonuclease/phosphatase family metal-dependent hydrolase
MIITHHDRQKCEGKKKVNYKGTLYQSRSKPAFLTDFADIVFRAISSEKDFVIAGDLNILVNNPEYTYAQRLLSILNDANLEQHVDHPTHTSGNTLDVVIGTKYCTLGMKMVGIDRSVSSDHWTVLLDVNLEKPPHTSPKQAHCEEMDVR